jgi:hypothetical protein
MSPAASRPIGPSPVSGAGSAFIAALPGLMSTSDRYPALVTPQADLRLGGLPYGTLTGNEPGISFGTMMGLRL